MKLLRNIPFVPNRIETLDFKTFCEGGSPEYVAAKQKVNLTYRQQQENSPYKSGGSHNIEESSLLNFEPSAEHHIVQSSMSFSAYSLYINPLAFFDIHFLIAAGCVVLVAVLEKKLADNGIIEPAAILSVILKIGFPLVAFGSILVLISKLGVFL
jgi:hypothetical protein